MHSLCAFYPERKKQEVMTQRVTEAKAVCPFTSNALGIYRQQDWSGALGYRAFKFPREPSQLGKTST